MHIDLERREIVEHDDVSCCRHSVEAHREQVLRRLLQGGLSARTLQIILPEWCGLIDTVAAETPS
ncbi:MAG: hypothetical protein JJT89_06705 [Nitriliruptoraceae bacterium]|nr:hypothetical protein [Nitriliruptoraceae bacterium]